MLQRLNINKLLKHNIKKGDKKYPLFCLHQSNIFHIFVSKIMIMNNSEALAKLKKHLKRRKEIIFGYFDENLTEAIESAISALEQFPPDWCCGSNRYDWKNIPRIYYWAAKNENGEVWAFLEKPELDEKHGVWNVKYVPHPLIQFIKSGEPSDDWKESLEERPQNFRVTN